MVALSKVNESTASAGLLAAQQVSTCLARLGAMSFATLSKVFGVKQNIPEFQ